MCLKLQILDQIFLHICVFLACLAVPRHNVVRGVERGRRDDAAEHVPLLQPAEDRQGRGGGGGVHIVPGNVNFYT